MSIFVRLQPVYHFVLAYTAALVFGFPSRKLVVIGVTGTKGKTTTVHLLHEILRESGIRAASLSSVRFRIGDEERKNETKMTMPGRFFVQRFLRDAAAAGCACAILEVTSQGIAQYRHRFIPFSVGVMTNVAPEHLESHGGFEKYLRAKLDLFWRLPRDALAILNHDDPLAPRFGASARSRRAEYRRDRIAINGKLWRISEADVGPEGISFEMDKTPMRSVLVGEFNLYNILAASAAALALGVAPIKIASALGCFSGVPGRMEYVRREPFAVVVDYAHTPDSLKNVYAFLRESSKFPSPIQSGISSKLICVLGAAGGGRDRWKRPEFGRIAAEYCDTIVLTNEDPYDEDPVAILDDIEKGIPPTYNLQPTTFRKIIDRREAIRLALRRAGAGDIVVITGKGAEPWMMESGGKRISWDDRAVVREEMPYLNVHRPLTQ